MSTLDLSHLLSTVKFWGVYRLPSELIRYLLEKSRSELEFDAICGVLQEFEVHFKLLELFKSFPPFRHSYSGILPVVARCGRIDVMEHFLTDGREVGLAVVREAAEHGHLDLLKYCVDNMRSRGKTPFKQISLRKIAGLGLVECMQYLLNSGCQRDLKICAAAAGNGHLECLKLAHEHHIGWDAKVTIAAADHNHLPCLMYACERGCTVTVDSACAAAQRGHQQCLVYLLTHTPLTVSKRMCNAAATAGQLECLQYLRSVGCPWDAACARVAAARGHLQCVEYVLHSGGVVDGTAADSAAHGGQLECLVYLHQHGVYASSVGVHKAIVKKLTTVLTFLRSEGVQYCNKHLTAAVKVDERAYLRRLYRAGYTLPDSIVDEVVEENSVRCLQYIVTHTTIPLHTTHISDAAYYDQLQCVQILHSAGCVWDVTTTAAAATNPTVECLQYLHEHGCAWDTTTANAAAEHGCLQCLQYAVEHGCRTDATTTAAAAKHHTTSCLHYLRSIHCPWDMHTLVSACMADSHACLVYAHGLVYCLQRGCTMNRVGFIMNMYSRYCKHNMLHTYDTEPEVEFIENAMWAALRSFRNGLLR